MSALLKCDTETLVLCNQMISHLKEDLKPKPNKTETFILGIHDTF